MSTPTFFLKEVGDPYIRDNFRRLDNFLRDFPFAKGEFKFFEIVITGAVTNFDFLHNLGFLPKDVITTNVSNNATVTWKYDSFTTTTVRLTTSAACTIRAFIGTYREGN